MSPSLGRNAIEVPGLLTWDGPAADHPSTFVPSYRLRLPQLSPPFHRIVIFLLRRPSRVHIRRTIGVWRGIIAGVHVLVLLGHAGGRQLEQTKCRSALGDHNLAGHRVQPFWQGGLIPDAQRVAARHHRWNY